jgi:hypothetical protein
MPGIGVPQAAHAPELRRTDLTVNPNLSTTVAEHDGQIVFSNSPTRPGRFPA